MEANEIMKQYHRDGIITNELKEYAYKNAIGILPLPIGAKLIFAEQVKSGNVYRYYEGPDGELYYDSVWEVESEKRLQREKQERYHQRYINRKRMRA